MTEQHTTPDDARPKGRSRFSGLHARTYEMELLLSGAVLFGLLQVPRLTSLFFDRFRAGLAGDHRLVGAYGETYVMLVLYALIGVFVLHLSMRAFWIGLVGLESVYPEGIRWHSLKAGPNTLDRYKRDVPQLARVVDRVDDLCSLVFSFGFLVVITFIYTVVLMLTAALVAVVVIKIAPDSGYGTAVFWTVLVGVVGVQLLAGITDRFFGPKVDPSGFATRLLRVLARIGFVLSPLRWIGVVQLTLQTNLTTTRVTSASLFVMVLLAVVFLGVRFTSKGLLRFDSRGYFPAELRERGVDPRHYRDRRQPGTVEPTYPSIQSDIIDGPFVVLFIPYYPRHHNPLFADACPGLKPLRKVGLAFRDRTEATDQQVREAAECMGSFFEVRLDAHPLDTLIYEFGVEPGSGLEALVAHIPAREMTPGRHQLEVLVPARPDRGTAGPPDPVRHLIPFWR